MSVKYNIRFSYQLTPIKANYNYYCVSVTDSLEFTPGECYTEKQVQELCNNPKWKVTVVAWNNSNYLYAAMSAVRLVRG